MLCKPSNHSFPATCPNTPYKVWRRGGLCTFSHSPATYRLPGSQGQQSFGDALPALLLWRGGNQKTLAWNAGDFVFINLEPGNRRCLRLVPMLAWAQRPSCLATEPQRLTVHAASPAPSPAAEWNTGLWPAERSAGGDKLWGRTSLLFKLMSFSSLGGSNNSAITSVFAFGWSRKLQTQRVSAAWLWCCTCAFPSHGVHHPPARKMNPALPHLSSCLLSNLSPRAKLPVLVACSSCLYGGLVKINAKNCIYFHFLISKASRLFSSRWDPEAHPSSLASDFFFFWWFERPVVLPGETAALQYTDNERKKLLTCWSTGEKKP